MIQDIFPHKLNNQFDPLANPEETDFVMVFEGTKILIKSKEEKVVFPTVKQISEESSLIFLFRLDETAYYFTKETIPCPDGYEYMEIKELRSQKMGPKHMIFAAMTAKHLKDWYRDTAFCGRCGHAMQHSEKERAMTCPSCGYTAYPRIMPAVIVGVINGNELLLTKYKNGYQHNALVAGFTEIGETLEETVAREVMEETGLHVKNIKYYKSQPWGMPNDILMGFYCEVDGDTEITMDDQELKYAAWVKRDEIILQPDDFSLTNEMMDQFKRGINPVF